jgi:hypothetical protein
MSPSEDISLPFELKRKQFPICLSFAMTINYMLHCQGVCQERRHGFWPSQSRTLINPEMFWSGEKDVFFYGLFLSVLLYLHNNF